MVATNYAVMAADSLPTGPPGGWSRCAAAPTPTWRSTTLTQGVKRVDVDELYDVEKYRPKVRHVHGKPMFLY